MLNHFLTLFGEIHPGVFSKAKSKYSTDAQHIAWKEQTALTPCYYLKKLS